MMMMLGFLAVVVGDQILDMCEGVLYAALEHMRLVGAGALLGGFGGELGGVNRTFALERRGLHYLAAQRRAQLLQINLIAVFAGNVDHVERDDHRYAQFSQLSSQIEVTLDVGRIDYIQYRVRLFVYQIAARHDFFQRIRRQAVYTGQVLNDYVVGALKAAFFLLNSNARPVTDVLIRARQVVEHCGFTTVRVTCQGNLDCHELFLLQNFGH